MRNIQKSKVQMINVNVDSGEKFNGEILNKVTFTKSDSTTFDIILNDDEINDAGLSLVAISENLKRLGEDYFTVEELDAFNSISWVNTSQERDYVPYRPRPEDDA